MTREVSRYMAACFKERKVATRMADNTYTTGDTLILHRTPIAWRYPDTGVIHTTLAGFNTQVTRDRLNALYLAYGLGAPYRQHDGDAWFNDTPIDPYSTQVMAGPLTMLALKHAA